MIKFLVYVAIILTVLAVGYLVRVFELASSLKGKRSEEITEKDNRLMGRIMLTFVVVFFLFVIWQLKNYGWRMLPEAASVHGKELDWLFNFNMGILWFVFVLTHILLFYFAYKYYGRKDNRATYFPHDNRLEMIWTVIPAIVLAVIVIYGIKTWNHITDVADPKSQVIELYAKQFDWTARYAGTDNTLGASNYKLITSTNDLGMDSTSSTGSDDIVVKNELHIVVNKEVEFKFRSRDVIHSAYFPHFRAQMNCVPGMTTMLHFTPTITTAEMRQKPEVIAQMAGINAVRKARGDKPEEFNYILLCNKICGNSHYNMQMTVIVETQAEYDKWLATKKPFFDKGGASAPSEKSAASDKGASETKDDMARDSIKLGNGGKEEMESRKNN
ncbi:MAG: Cytochrome oxidase subunit [Bacteroidetes bacterium]|nr:Cytochrome oxidase subunit [Bacteroidota bacterium]